MKKMTLTYDNVKHVGRTYLKDQTLWLILSGSGISFTFTGKSLSAVFVGREASTRENNEENYARMAVYVNEKRVIDTLIDAPQKECVILDSEKEQTVSVRILKLSECAMSMCGIASLEIGEGNISPEPTKKHKLEIIGDSITCGYGVDDENCEHHFKTATEDVTKSYSYKTAVALDADYSMFSTSGHGIITGYTDDGQTKHTDQLIPQRYTTYGLCFDTFDGTLQTTDLTWDFDRFQPDAIIINLGTNDDSYCQDFPNRQEEYKDAYIRFLFSVREYNPKARIFCILGLMGARLFPSICQACTEYTAATGDTNITTFQLPEQDGNIGYAADYHPMECFHTAACEKLVPFIKEQMHW